MDDEWQLSVNMTKSIFLTKHIFHYRSDCRVYCLEQELR